MSGEEAMILSYIQAASNEGARLKHILVEGKETHRSPRVQGSGQNISRRKQISTRPLSTDA